MDNYLYVAKGNPYLGIEIYRIDKYETYSISTDLGETYTNIDSSEIDERTLDWLTKAYTKRWNQEPKKIYTKPIMTRNDSDVGITKEQLLKEIFRIYGSFIEYDTKENRLYNISYDTTNKKVRHPFNLQLLRKLAIKYHYYGSLYEVSRW